MSKEDEILAHLEAIRKELQEGKQQTTAALSMPLEQPQQRTSRSLQVRFRRVAIILFVIILLNAIAGFAAYKLLSKEEPKIDQGTILEQVQELSSLATSQALVKAVIEKEDNQLFGKEIKTNIPGTKRKILLVIPGSVLAGINLELVNSDTIKINEDDNVVELFLPRAEIIQEPSLNFEQAQTFSVEGIFRGEVNWEEAYELAHEAKLLVKEEAIAQGLLETAEQNGEKVLKEFFSHLGYDCIVHYVD